MRGRLNAMTTNTTTMNTTTTTLWRLPCHRSQQEEEGKDELGGGVKETEVIHDMADEQQVITEK